LPPKLAIEGAQPVRQSLLPYGRHWLTEEDIAAVVQVLRSDWLTTGPAVEAFEREFAEKAGAHHAIAVCNGTAALHTAMHTLSLGPQDEVIVPAITFAASANCVVYEGATPVFADIDPETLLVDVNEVERRITPRTRAIMAVDYAGQPCPYDELNELASRHRLALVADACHAAGASYRGRAVGSLAKLNCFSFHPVKHVTTGEGGMVTTDDAELAIRMRAFRNHGITTDHRQRAEKGQFYYEMTDLGFNYRLTDFQCVLGMSQLRRLDEFIAKRRALAARYDAALAQIPGVRPLGRRSDACHAYHLYVVRLDLDRLTVARDAIFKALRAEGIGVNVHYLPVYLHPFYRKRFGTAPGLCPTAEAAYEGLLSLPIFPAMSDADAEDVIAALDKVLDHYRK
jgi:perosamine synthetase